ncbi:MAG: leucine-rich repeat family protein / extensin family protein [Mycobacterium sp.]|jgi:hypothetical protein|nr:leucine-rich repeat family protein / extensin family protein [Mycobacterium sp.]MDT5311724.1 hypothetical protein [Mycobacterium sp.]
MTEGQRVTAANAAKIVVAGMLIAGGALAMAGQATADPDVPYTPVPGAPDAPPAPGQPVVEGGDAPMAAPAPPPVGAPVVPEIANQTYGSGSGPLGFLRDAWHQAKDPYGVGDSPDGMPEGAAPPPGAGPPPPLPPGFKSLNFPESDAPATQAAPNSGGGPALPPGYYPLNGPPPPGYEAPPAPADPAAPPILPAPPG